jgi:EmrB/QacA subfamily drug resistance transporter
VSFALASVLSALVLTLLLEALDQTIVGAALPRIVASLQVYDRYTWAVTAYTLGSCSLIPIVGKLSDQFGRKWFLIGGTVLFLLGSTLSGLSQTMNQLIAFRALQGIGAGMGIALAFTVVADIFPPAERAKWSGLFGGVYGVASVIGPSLGGWLTDHGSLVGNLVTDATRWRWVFYINILLGILTLLSLFLYLPANLAVRNSSYTGWAAVRRIDVLGSVLAARATISLLLGLTWGSNQVYAWNSPQVIGTLAGAAALYVLFVVTERFAVKPILPLELFRNAIFTVSALLSLGQLTVLIGGVVYLPLFLQGVQGESASSSGAVITPLTFASLAGATLAAAVMAKTKRYQGVLIIAAVVMVVGAFLLTRLTPTSGAIETLIVMVILGLGIGPFFTGPTVAAQNSLRPEQLGAGTAAVRYMGQLGLVLGVAVIGSVVNNVLASEITPRLQRIPGIANIPQPVITQATNLQVLVNADYRHALLRAVVQQTPPAYQSAAQQTLNAIFDALKQSLNVGLHDGFLVILGLSVVAVVLAFFLRDVPLRKTS